MLSHFGEHLRNFRRKLYVNFVLPNLNKPNILKKVPRKYRMVVKQEDWDKFITFRESDECKVVNYTFTFFKITLMSFFSMDFC